jgi:lon-related putative ATP-dependent protease
MTRPKPLDYRALKSGLRAFLPPFRTTNDLKQSHPTIGQSRALEALHFGLRIQHRRYHLYAMGSPGIGKHAVVEQLVRDYAKRMPTPPDWCYINNFESPSKPIAIALPAGMGRSLQRDMKAFVEELGTIVQSMFDSKQFRSEMRKIDKFYNKKFKQKTSTGSTEDRIKVFSKEKFEKEKLLRVKLIKSVIVPRIAALKRKYKKYIEIKKYLSAVHQDILAHVNDLMRVDETTHTWPVLTEHIMLAKYSVNLLVDNKGLKGAPVIFEPNPNFSNLICRIEHLPQQGSMMPHFTLLKPGCLHVANGGYLMLEIRKLRKHAEAWEALKSALYAQSIKVEPPERTPTLVKPISLEPTPIPLSIKIILLGDRNTYYDLCQEDVDFAKLFKVIVDFDESVDRDEKNIKRYVQWIGMLVKRDQLHPFHRDAVAAVLDYCSRLSEDAKKLSTHFRDIEDLMVEANYCALLRHAKLVRAKDVQTAIYAKAHRVDRTREMYYEDIHRHFIIIHTKGKMVGQVNCLSVRQVGHFSYGHPTRVTARVRPGKGQLIDIQREIKMAGPMHSKAGLIIANFLASRFGADELFSLSASISFEQVYVWTDGDSASVGELCALLSALAEVPLEQSLAVTGSIDQYGEVQAVGCVNEKIEGFFDVCKRSGLTGRQGVLIPSINQANLVLREDVIAAVKAKQFFIYPINTIDEAMILLSGKSAGERQKNGEFAKKSIYHIVEKKLKRFSKKQGMMSRLNAR